MTGSFASLVDDVVRERARRRPAWATTEGYPGFDEHLMDPSPEAYAAEAAAARAFLARLDDAAGGAPGERAALAYVLRLEIFEAERLRTWARNPDLASELMDHLFPLLIRVGRPVESRAAAMAARLERATAFLHAGRRRVDVAAVPPLWVEVATETAASSPAFLDAVRGAAREAAPATRARLDAAAEGAARALADHLDWLGRAVGPGARGSWSAGAETFEALLVARELPGDAAGLLATGEREVARLRAEVQEAAATVLAAAGRDPAGAGVRDAMDVVRRDHPATFEAVLAEYRAVAEEARRFVAERGLATVPGAGEAPLDVVETPSYLRPLVPFAAYVAPGRWDAEARGTYLVTPKADLSAFARADVRTTTVHEAYPGHHLHLVRAREQPSLAKYLCAAPETAEGWALYGEIVMGRHGFTARPEERFMRARDSLWRAVRIVLDVSLHTGRMTFEDAVRTLVEETAMTQAEAAAEVKRYTREPAYNLSYALGRIIIEELRATAERLPGFTERTFHDALVREGSIPLSILARELHARRSETDVATG